jgi:hypothetical protein
MEIKSPNFNFLAKLDFVLIHKAEFAERSIFKPHGPDFLMAQINI